MTDDKEEVVLSEEFNDELLETDGYELDEILLNTQEQCQMMEEMIETQIKVKDEMINKLHKELQFYKEDMTNKYLTQLLKAVIKVRKEMRKRINSSNWENMELEDIKREYIYVFEDLTDLLQQEGVDEYVTEDGKDFNPKIHQAKIEETDDKSLNKKIKTSLSEGYMKDDKVLITERVLVYQHKGE